MESHEKYESMKDQGSNAGQVYRAGKADSLDEIALLRMIRSVFHLSLVEAKRAIGASTWLDAKQEIHQGAKVYWDVWDTMEGWSLMEARVASIDGHNAHLENLKKYRAIHGELFEAPFESPGLREVKVSYLERPLTERLAESMFFVRELAKINEE